MSLLLRMYPGDAWGFLIANVLVQVTAVFLMAWFLAHLGSRWNAAWRHGIYLVALICVLASPLLSLVMQGTGIALLKLPSLVPTAVPAPLPIARISESDPIETLTEPKLSASRAPLEAESLGQDVQPKTTPAPSLSDVLRAFVAGALAFWLLGMALLLARWCYGLHLIAVLRRTAQPLNGEAIVEALDRVRRTLFADELPPMAVSASLDRPVMIGLIRPLVILPEDLLGTLRGPELADILVHECAHAVCRHQVVGLLQRLAGILFWPHPLIYLLNRELARAREEVCDNYVLRHGNAPRYARTLLELSQSFVGVSSHPTALGLFPCRWRLEDRVADLLDRRRKIMIRVNHWATTALAASFLLLALLIACTRVIHAEPATEKLRTVPGARTAEKAASPASSSISPLQPADEQTTEKAASPASLAGSPDQSSRLTLQPADESRLTLQQPADESRLTLQPADEASPGKAKPTKQTEATEPSPLSQVVDYLHVHDKDKNTMINNHKIEKRLIGRVYKGIVIVLDVCGDEKKATIVTPDFYFEITKPEIIEKAAELPKGAKVSITAKLKWFTYETVVTEPLRQGHSVPTQYRAVFDDPQNMEIRRSGEGSHVNVDVPTDHRPRFDGQIVPAEKLLPKD